MSTGVVWGSLIVLAFGTVSAGELDAQYELNRQVCSIEGNRFTIEVVTILTVLNAHGDQYAEVSLFENKYISLDDVLIEIRDAAGGRVSQIKKKDLSSWTGFAGGMFYSDVIQYHAETRAPTYPYTVETRYRVTGKSLMHLWPFEVQRKIPVVRAEFELSHPAELEVRYHLYGAKATPLEMEEQGRRRLVWEFDRVPPLPDVDYVPDGFNEPIRLELAADRWNLEGVELNGCTWENIGYWAKALSADRYLAKPELPVSPPADPNAVVRAEYDRVIREMHYVAIEVGIGGWQPHPAQLVEQRGFGDCKDLSTLLISRLRNAGIEAYPCLVKTRDRGRIDIAFPAVDFNHVITMALVGNDTVWMDPTCDHCPLGDLPPGDEGIPVLAVTDDGGVIRYTPMSTSEDNTVTRTITLRLQRDRTLSVSAAMEYTGNLAWVLRAFIEGKPYDEIRQVVLDMLPGASERYAIDTFAIGNLEALNEPLRISTEGHSFRPERAFNSILYLDPFLMCGLSRRFETELEKRVLPLSVFHPATNIDRITVVWDSAFSIDSVVLPAGASGTFPFGSLSLTSIGRETAVEIETDVEIEREMIAVAEFAEFEDFRHLLREMYQKRVKFILAE